MKQPDLIKYNLNDRGRNHTGQERNFNIQKLCEEINGYKIQERIKNRDMIGYYGHEVRRMIGLNPQESKIINGKQVTFEPAIVTTYAKLSPNGDFEHKTEFLETADGIKAAKTWASNVGGFSTAINKNTSQFFGMDYVFSPNYNYNRGYALDSTESSDDLLKDIYQERDAMMLAVIAKKDSEILELSQTVNILQDDNDYIADFLVRKGINNLVLDDCQEDAPLRFDNSKINQLNQAIAEFHGAKKLPSLRDAAVTGNTSNNTTSYITNRTR